MNSGTDMNKIHNERKSKKCMGVFNKVQRETRSSLCSLLISTEILAASVKEHIIIDSAVFPGL